uniref:KAPP n=1 Tax=Arundo donax TaxID=35708 RepID=A0A0A9EYQ0_ARUDO
MSTSSHFNVFAFQFIRACFPDTSESFNTKSLGGTLPRIIGSKEGLVDCREQLIP